MIPVIICGGVGTKMWPLSTPSLPKHFLPLINGESLFEINWKALRLKFKPEQIFVQTNAEQAKIAKTQVSEIVDANILVEPCMKNQGPATGLSAALLAQKGHGDEPFFLVQADDLRIPEENIFPMIDICEELAQTPDRYITGGFIPDRVIRGVDYLLKGDLVLEKNGVKVYKVEDYVDRSEEEKINKFLNSNRLMVHANHTCMTPNNLMKMYQEYKPEWYEPLSRIAGGASIKEEFESMPKGAIEEITKQMHIKGKSLVVEIPFKWVDFGTWESTDKYFQENDIEPINGGVTTIDSENVFAWSESKKPIAVIGLKNICVIEGSAGILVCDKSKTGRVGEIPEILKAVSLKKN